MRARTYITHLGMPTAVLEGIRQGRWRQAKNPKAYLKTIARREAVKLGLTEAPAKELVLVRPQLSRTDAPASRTTLEQACGQIIVHYREKLGLSQMDLAVATGYSLRYVGDIEREAKSSTLRTMNDLSTLFNIRLGSLIAEAEALLSSKSRDDRTPSTGKGKSRMMRLLKRSMK